MMFWLFWDKLCIFVFVILWNKMENKLALIDSQYLNKYIAECKINLTDEFKLREKSNFTTEDFDYYLAAFLLFILQRLKGIVLI